MGHFRNNNLYLNSIKGIRKSSDLLELEKVLNEHELHTILEGIDVMFKYSDYKKINFNQRNPEREQELRNFVMDGENMKKLSNQLVGGENLSGGGNLDNLSGGGNLDNLSGRDNLDNLSGRGNLENLSGGGHVAKYDIIAYVNGDKRNSIKKRIIDIIYIHNKIDGKAISEGAENNNSTIIPEDFKDTLPGKLSKLKNDETLDNCFNAFLQQKVLTHLGINTKDKNPYYRGEFQTFTSECLKKKLFNTHIFYNNMPKLVYENKIIGNQPNYKEKFVISDNKIEDEDLKKKNYEVINDDFEFLQSRSMVNVEYLTYLYDNKGNEEESKEKLEELIELINVYHELQIPDTVMARNKEKMMKKYLSKISMVIIVLGMIPPEFFGPDSDYNIFDIFSTVMCIFEGSTVCAVMSALPLFSPLLDALSTFSFMRKIFNKFGMSGAMGKRSKAAITKAREAKVNKIKKQQETLAQVQTNIHKQNLNLHKAKSQSGPKAQIEAQKIEANLMELGAQNKKLTAQVEKQAQKSLAKAEKVAATEAKGIEKVMKKIKKEGLSDAEKMKITKHREHLELQLGAANKTKNTSEIKKINKKITELKQSVKGDSKLEALSELGERNAKFAIEGASNASEQMKMANQINNGKLTDKTSETYKIKAEKYEEYMNTKDLAGTISSGKVKPFGATEKTPFGKLDHPGMKKLKDQFPGKFDPITGKPHLTNGSMTFTAQEAKLMSKSADDTLSAVTGPFLQNQLNLATKKLNLAQSGKFGITELSYLKATHPGRFKDAQKPLAEMQLELAALEKVAAKRKVAERAQKKAARATEAEKSSAQLAIKFDVNLEYLRKISPEKLKFSSTGLPKGIKDLKTTKGKKLTDFEQIQIYKDILKKKGLPYPYTPGTVPTEVALYMKNFKKLEKTAIKQEPFQQMAKATNKFDDFKGLLKTTKGKKSSFIKNEMAKISKGLSEVDKIKMTRFLKDSGKYRITKAFRKTKRAMPGRTKIRRAKAENKAMKFIDSFGNKLNKTEKIIFKNYIRDFRGKKWGTQMEKTFNSVAKSIPQGKMTQVELRTLRRQLKDMGGKKRFTYGKSKGMRRAEFANNLGITKKQLDDAFKGSYKRFRSTGKNKFYEALKTKDLTAAQKRFMYEKARRLYSKRPNFMRTSRTIKKPGASFKARQARAEARADAQKEVMQLLKKQPQPHTQEMTKIITEFNTAIKDPKKTLANIDHILNPLLKKNPEEFRRLEQLLRKSYGKSTSSAQIKLAEELGISLGQLDKTGKTFKGPRSFGARTRRFRGRPEFIEGMNTYPNFKKLSKVEKELIYQKMRGAYSYRPKFTRIRGTMSNKIPYGLARTTRKAEAAKSARTTLANYPNNATDILKQLKDGEKWSEMSKSFEAFAASNPKMTQVELRTLRRHLKNATGKKRFTYGKSKGMRKAKFMNNVGVPPKNSNKLTGLFKKNDKQAFRIFKNLTKNKDLTETQLVLLYREGLRLYGPSKLRGTRRALKRLTGQTTKLKRAKMADKTLSKLDTQVDNLLKKSLRDSMPNAKEEEILEFMKNLKTYEKISNVKNSFTLTGKIRQINPNFSVKEAQNLTENILKISNQKKKFKNYLQGKYITEGLKKGSTTRKTITPAALTNLEKALGDLPGVTKVAARNFRKQTQSSIGQWRLRRGAPKTLKQARANNVDKLLRSKFGKEIDQDALSILKTKFKKGYNKKALDEFLISRQLDEGAEATRLLRRQIKDTMGKKK